jgi:sporulation integral membrane protein YtvI
MDTEYKKAANLTIIAAGILLLFILFIRYALDALLPFLLGALIAAIVAPISKKISKGAKVHRKLTSAILVISLFSLISILLYLGGARLIRESGNLIERLSGNPAIVGDFIDVFLKKIENSKLSALINSDALERLGVNIDDLLSNALESMISSISAYLPSLAVNVVAKIPSILFFIIVFLISAFYFSTDRDTISKGLSSFLPDSWQRRLPAVKERFQQTITGYLKAYFLIMLLTFAEIFIGLSILRVNYALLLAILIAVVDILPIIGTGTILIPWAIVSFLTGDVGLGTGLLILYGVVMIVRQIAEPKIVGNSIGLHPLATLAAVYLGIKFVGFLGIFIGPIIALCVKGFSKEPATK